MRIKRYFPLFLLVIFSSFAQAQNPSRTTIKGALQDTTHEAIPFATVMLLNPSDSSLVNFTTTNDAGIFSFNNIKNVTYLLKIQHVSFLPLQIRLVPSATELNDLKSVGMKPLSRTLLEVVIKAAKAPLFIRGDTIEYDASTFKVPPGSTVEDLLRRLPGIQVDADGNISAQGKDVKHMYVDGKTFFGDDPKSVTKNLGAEAISKVQVYNEKSEQAKLTGIDDGTKEKAMNLALKEEFKKGSFGKITAAAGNEERLAGRGNYNRFNDKTQLSFIGYANNINQTGVNWEDYGEFKGNNTFNDYDNGDFGFNSNRNMIFISGSDIPGGFYDGKGLTKNLGAGTNFNYTDKKTKFNGSYFYNQTKLDYLQKTFRQTFIEDGSSFTKHDTLNNSDFRSSHTIGSRFEKEFDSTNKLIVKANFRFSYNDNKALDGQQFSDLYQQPYNNLNLDNSTELSAYTITSAAIYRHRFKKKGRTFASSVGYNKNMNNGRENLNSLNSFFSATTPTEQIRKLNNTDKNVTELKASLLYSEPLSKKWYLEFFYNLSSLGNASNNQVTAPLLDNSRIDSLSVYFEQSTLYNRFGSVIRYSNNGLNGSIGVAAHVLGLTGLYATDKGLPWNNKKVTKTYPNYTPNLSLSYQLKNNMQIEINYSNTITPPEFGDLQPLKNTSNPAYLVVGNPDLVPENTHNIGFNFNYWDPSSFANIGLNGSYGITLDPIVYNQETVFKPGTGMLSISTPENMDKGNQFNTWLWSNIPIIKTKLTVNFYGGLNRSNRPTRINTVLDEIRSNGFNFGTGLSFTPGTKLVLSLNGSGRFSKIKYKENGQQNQNYYNYSLGSSVKWQFATRMFFESNFNYSVYKNEKFNFNQNIPLWNASVRRIMGKKNKFEMRIAAFDIFNKNIDISQYASKNYIESSTANTLARYFMLSLTYNMKGFENKIQKNRFF